jgi:integrase
LSKRQAEKLRTELLSQVDSGTYRKPTKETVGDFMLKWLTSHKPNITARSLDRYTGIVNYHIIPSIGNILLTHLTPERIQGLYIAKLDTGLSPRTIKYIHTVLHKALSTAIKWHKIGTNPCDSVDLPKAQHTEMQIWSESEIPKFLDASRNTPYYYLFYTALFTGARRGELLALRWQDCDLFNGQLSISRSVQHVKGKYIFSQPKSEKSRRTIALPPSTTIRLKQLRESTEHLRSRLGQTVRDSDLVFTHTFDGKPLRPNTVSRAWEIIAKKAGLKVIRFHDARHTHASLLLRQGVPLKVVSERLGHSSISITADIYSHVTPGMQESAAKLFDDAISTKYNEIEKSVTIP